MKLCIRQMAYCFRCFDFFPPPSYEGWLLNEVLSLVWSYLLGLRPLEKQ